MTREQIFIDIENKLNTICNNFALYLSNNSSQQVIDIAMFDIEAIQQDFSHIKSDNKISDQQLEQYRKDVNQMYNDYLEVWNTIITGGKNV